MVHPSTSWIDVIDSLDRLSQIREYLLEETLIRMPVKDGDKHLAQSRWLFGLADDCFREELESLRAMVVEISSAKGGDGS